MLSHHLDGDYHGVLLSNVDGVGWSAGFDPLLTKIHQIPTKKHLSSVAVFCQEGNMLGLEGGDFRLNG